MLRCRQAVVLAAGRGSRLGAMTFDRPKCLLEVGGTPLIDRFIATLAGAGFDEVVVVIGHRAEAVRAHVAAAGAPIRVVLVESDDYLASNNSSSLWAARDRVRPPFLLADGDLWLAPRVVADLALPDRMALAASRRPGSGTHAVVDGSRVTGLELAGGQAAGGHKTVNAASFSPTWWAEWFRPALEQVIAGDRRAAFYEAAIAAALAAGAPPLEPILVHDDEWCEIDTPDDLLRAQGRLAAPRS